MSTSVSRELRDIRTMPYGTARIAAAEALSRRVEAEGPRENLAEALLDLVEAYTFASEGAKSFVVFARLLRLWDESPELFDEGDEHNLFWEFKWIAGDLPDYPQITRDQAEAFLADMERRFELAGHGLSSVRMSRFRWSWHAGQPGTEQLRLAWVTGLRDEFEDCPACTIGQQVDYFTETGRHREAVALGVTQESSCNLEPARTQYALALSALLAGDPELALTSHRRALASDDGGADDFSPARGQGFETLARGGRLDQALRVLRNDHASLLRRGSTPLFRLRFLLGVLAGLSANLDRGDLETGLRDAPWRTVAELHAWVREECESLATQLDDRDGSSYYADLLGRALAATPADAPLAPESSDRAWARGQDESGAVPGDGDGVGAASGPGETAGRDDVGASASAALLFARAEELAAGRDHARAGEAYLRAARAAESEGLVAEAGLAWAEAAQCAVVTGDEALAHERFALAVPRLAAGDADPEVRVAVLTAWAPVAARMDDATAQLEATAAMLAEHGEPDLAGLSDELATRRRADWTRRRATLRDTLARSIAAAPPAARPPGLDAARAAAEALSAGEELAQLGLLKDAAHAFWLAGTVQRESGDAEAALWALESAFEGFTAAGLRTERARAAGDLLELLRETGRIERADEITAQLTDKG